MGRVPPTILGVLGILLPTHDRSLLLLELVSGTIFQVKMKKHQRLFMTMPSELVSRNRVWGTGSRWQLSRMEGEARRRQELTWIPSTSTQPVLPRAKLAHDLGPYDGPQILDSYPGLCPNPTPLVGNGPFRSVTVCLSSHSLSVETMGP